MVVFTMVLVEVQQRCTIPASFSSLGIHDWDLLGFLSFVPMSRCALGTKFAIRQSRTDSRLPAQYWPLSLSRMPSEDSEMSQSPKPPQGEVGQSESGPPHPLAARSMSFSGILAFIGPGLMSGKRFVAYTSLRVTPK